MSPDFRDLLSEFNARGVGYPVVGAQAVAAHGRVRATSDLDVWVRPEPGNAQRVLRALRAFGAPLADVGLADLSAPGVFFQIGVAPLRIDVLTAIDAVDFDEAWSSRTIATFAGVTVPVLALELQLRNQRAAGGKQDLADVEWLERNARS
jgi:hypothetical protein